MLVYASRKITIPVTLHCGVASLISMATNQNYFHFVRHLGFRGLFHFIMVKLHLKQGDESLFLYETTCQAELSELIPQLVRIQNGRLKIERLFYGKYKCKLKMIVNLCS